jgi:hypothetical protein
MTDPKPIRSLIDKLRVEFGFMLSAEDVEQIESDPPITSDDLTDEFFRASGLDPLGADRALWRQVKRAILDWYENQ